jgi:hypothetical protein
MYVKTSNEQVETYPYSIGQLRKDNPNTSFPKTPTPELLAEWGVYPVTPVDRPQADHTKNVTEGDPVQVNGAWLQNWVVTDATTEEIAERVADAWSRLRSNRNVKLMDCDWTQVADSPVDQAAWAAYRQALRDLPQNTTDPFNPVWPSEPA